MVTNTLREYASELEGILSRFSNTSNSFHIQRGDTARFRQISFELGDIFKDELTDGTRYYQQLMSDYNESITNWLNSPSYAGVERVLVLVNAVISRIDRNPSIIGKSSNNYMDKIEKNDSFIRLISDKFYLVARQFRERHDHRPTLDINDEYDVQDMFHSLLLLNYEDIRKEEWIPSYAGGASRSDFFLPEVETIIEIKKTRKGLGAKEIGDQLIVDIQRYQQHPGCRKIFCFVYDPEGRIGNPNGIENDLTKNSDEIEVEVVIVPKGY